MRTRPIYSAVGLMTLGGRSTMTYTFTQTAQPDKTVLTAILLTKDGRHGRTRYGGNRPMDGDFLHMIVDMLTPNGPNPIGPERSNCRPLKETSFIIDLTLCWRDTEGPVSGRQLRAVLMGRFYDLSSHYCRTYQLSPRSSSTSKHIPENLSTNLSTPWHMRHIGMQKRNPVLDFEVKEVLQGSRPGCEQWPLLTIAKLKT